LIDAAKSLNLDLEIISREEIKKIQDQFEGSDFVEKNIGVIMVDVSFYMLVEEEGSFSLALYDSERNVISNYSNLRQNVVNDYIENLENEREFFISWDEKKSEYLSIDSTLLKYLLENGNFVNSDFEKIEKQHNIFVLVGNGFDIAVLKIQSNEKFKPLEFADSDNVQIGQWSIAFGNPMGLNDSMTVGVVSAAGRSSLGIEQIENFIQTDAAINQGNSGGPLIDINGKVIGVNTAILSQSGGSVGLGFAIPSDLVVAVKDSLISTGKFEKPYLGAYLGNLDSEVVKALKLKSSNGVLIAKVTPNGPAAQAGLQANDVITAVNGKSIISGGSFIGELAAKKAGDKVQLTIVRNGKEMNVTATLGKTPQQQIIQQQQLQQQQQQQEQQIYPNFGR